MTKQVIAIDAMGGDHGPPVTVGAAKLALEKNRLSLVAHLVDVEIPDAVDERPGLEIGEPLSSLLQRR